TGQDVLIQPAATNDIATLLKLGTAQGGFEVSAFAKLRPAPTGVVFNAIDHLDDLATLASVTIETATTISPALSAGMSMQDRIDAFVTTVNGAATLDPQFTWKAERWGHRLALLRTAGADNASIAALGTTPAASSADFTRNVRYYSVGFSGGG